MQLETQLPLLLDLLLKSAVVLLLTAGTAIICRGISAANRHTVWLAALCALALLPVTKLAKPRWAYGLKAQTSITALAGAPGIVSKTVLPTVRTNPAAPDTGEAPASWRIAVDWPAAGVALWLAGALLLLARRATVGWRVRRLVGRSVAATDERVLAMAEALAADAGLQFHVRVSEECRIPLAFGVRRPLVLLPMQALSWSDARLMAALRHELGHLRRGDCLTRLLADLLCAAYWVNPLIWMATRSLRVAQEQACDDLVLCAGADAADYASQLIDVVRSLGSDRISTRYALAMAQPSTLETRVRSIVDETRDRRPLSRPVAAGAVAAVMAFLALCGAAQLSAAEKSKPSEASKAASSQVDLNTPQIEIEAKFIEFAEDAEDSLNAVGLPMPLGPGARPGGLAGILAEAQAQSVFKAINHTKEVNLLSAPRVTTKSKQRATIEVVREFRYATKFAKGETPGTWKPEAFETRDVGATLQVKPTVTPEGNIDLEIAPEVVEFEGFIDLDNGGKAVPPSPASSKPLGERLTDTPASSPPTGHRLQPVFSTRKATTSVTTYPGQTLVIECPAVETNGETAKSLEPGKAKRRLIVFVTAKIVSPNNGPVTITSDSITRDSATGVMKATGNVKIETPLGVINAEKVEFKPRAGARTAPEATALERAEKIVIPKVVFHDASVLEVVEYLRHQSIELDPEHKGVNIFLQPLDKSDARVTLSLSKIPIVEILKYVAALSGLELVPEPFALTLKPPGTKPAETQKPAAQTMPAPGALEAVWRHGETAQRLGRTTPALGTPEAALLERAKGIILPHIELKDATVDECVEYLRQKSIELDPAKKGLNIVVKHSKSSAEARITLSLAKIPVAEALRYVASLAGLEITTQADGFLLHPADE